MVNEESDTRHSEVVVSTDSSESADQGIAAKLNPFPLTEAAVDRDCVITFGEKDYQMYAGQSFTIMLGKLCLTGPAERDHVPTLQQQNYVRGIEAALTVAKTHGSHGEFTHGGREECVDYIIAEIAALRKPSTAGVLGNPEGGMSPETEIPESSSQRVPLPAEIEAIRRKRNALALGDVDDLFAALDSAGSDSFRLGVEATLNVITHDNLMKHFNDDEVDAFTVGAIVGRSRKLIRTLIPDAGGDQEAEKHSG